jgi:hypothetical protein
VLRLVVRN